MSSNNGTKPKSHPFNRTEYWMVSGEWEELVQEPGSPIATAENPNPSQGRSFLVRKTTCDVIACHPALHAMRMTATGTKTYRHNYIPIYALPITKEQFEWIMGLQPGSPPEEVSKMAEEHFDKKPS